MASSALLLMVMTACVTVQALTERAKLESWNYAYYARNWGHVGSVTAMDLVEVHSASPMPDCRANVTFGFYGATTWVKGGCRGDFDVDIDETDTMEQKFDQLTNDVNDEAAKTVNVTREVDAQSTFLDLQSKLIVELRCTVANLTDAWLIEDHWVHGCCCPAGWMYHQPDGQRICYRQTETLRVLHTLPEAKSVCEALHPRSTVVMPKTKAQLKVLKTYSLRYEYDHIGMDIDASGNHTWHDGDAVDPDVVQNFRWDDDPRPCSDTHDMLWSQYVNNFYCWEEDSPPSQWDRQQMCQFILNDDCMST